MTTLHVLTEEEYMVRWMANRLYMYRTDQDRHTFLKIIKYHSQMVTDEFENEDMLSYIMAYAETGAIVSVPDHKALAEKVIQYLRDLFRYEFEHIEPLPE